MIMILRVFISHVHRQVKNYIQKISITSIMPKTHAPETGTENWHQKPVFWYQFFSYQMKLEAKFLD